MKHAIHIFGFVLAFIVIAAEGHAHIGSPNVYFTGSAGPYPVHVVIRPPVAMPGRAEINITVDADGVRQVMVLAAPPDAPVENLPPADLAPPVPGAANLYTAELWIMEPGAYAVQVKVAGAQGDGETIVPLNAVNLAPTAMPKSLQVTLAILTTLLVAGAVILAGAAVRESDLAPGVQPPARRKRLATIASGGTAVLMLAVIVLGWRTWRRMDLDYRTNQLFKPLAITAQVDVAGPARLLTLARLPDERGNRTWPRLITDHGKLMHAFLVREPQLDAFAHIHPRPAGDRFEVAIPPLPAGTYRVYVDITQEDGLSQTLTTTVPVPDAPATVAPDLADGNPRLITDPDDSWHLDARSNANSRETATIYPLPNGYRMVWKNPEVVQHAGESELQFEVLNPQGDPVALVPYMGMLGHAAIRREDGAVFVHLHPTGSISMASQTLFEQSASGSRDRGGDGDSMGGMDHSRHAMGKAMGAMNRVIFPYAFPRNGPYRIWVQVKLEETVMTGVFDTRVTAADSD